MPSSKAQTPVGCTAMWLWAVAATVVWSPRVEGTLLHSVIDSVDADIAGRRSELSKGLLMASLRLDRTGGKKHEYFPS